MHKNRKVTAPGAKPFSEMTQITNLRQRSGATKLFPFCTFRRNSLLRLSVLQRKKVTFVIVQADVNQVSIKKHK
jgi:hypothetical protein